MGVTAEKQKSIDPPVDDASGLILEIMRGVSKKECVTEQKTRGERKMIKFPTIN